MLLSKSFQFSLSWCFQCACFDCPLRKCMPGFNRKAWALCQHRAEPGKFGMKPTRLPSFLWASMCLCQGWEDEAWIWGSGSSEMLGSMAGPSLSYAVHGALTRKKIERKFPLVWTEIKSISLPHEAFTNVIRDYIYSHRLLVILVFFAFSQDTSNSTIHTANNASSGCGGWIWPTGKVKGSGGQQSAPGSPKTP